MSTAPVIIRREAPARGPSPVSFASYGSSPGTSLPPLSPPSAYVYPGSLGIAGASPPYRGGSSAAGDKTNPYLAAKKFWKRLCFDPALDPSEYAIGFIETVQQPERKSGVEAWSMRLHDRLLELPFDQFVEHFCGGGEGAAGGFAAATGANSSSAAGAAAGGADGGSNARYTSPSPIALSGGGWSGPQQSTSEEASSDVPYHRIAYFKHGNVVVWESEYHKRRMSELQAASPAGPSDGGTGSGGAADRPPRSQRRSSREVSVMAPPMPPASPAGGMTTLPGSLYGSTPPSRFGSLLGGSGVAGVALGGLGGGGGGGVVGRRLRGASVHGSDEDGIEGASSDDGEADMLLLEEEEEEEEEDEGEAADGELAGLSSDEGGGGGRRLATAAAVARLLGSGGLPGGGAGCVGGATEAAEAPPVPQLPEECWMAMMSQLLGVREVCMVGRTCRWLRQLASDPAVWRAQYEALWGSPPDPQTAAAVVRRLCRRSQLRAARWLEATPSGAPMGFPSTTCLQLDDSKVVSADGNAVRLWSHATGRRIATLQGHPGRVTCAAFDEALLISGCAGAVVKLWDLDELRCRRTLRGHDGAVTSCCLLANGIPASGAEDGVMRLWDVHTGSSIVALEAGHPVRAMQAHGPSGHLVSAAGWAVQLWDVPTATLLHTLGATTAADDQADTAGGAAGRVSWQHPYTCVSYMGDLLAAGRQGEVVLMDARVSGPVGRLACGTRGGSGGGAGMGAIAAAAGGGRACGAGDGGGSGASCVGVQLDEWKLVCGFDDGQHQLNVYDIRALPKGSANAGAGGGGARRTWSEPLMTLRAPARINAFQFHEQNLLVGLEGTECIMWRFENPGTAAAAATAAAAGGGLARPGGTPGGAGGPAGGAGGGSGTCGGLDGPGGYGESPGAGGGRKEKKKPAKVAKKQTRYPKRNTK